MDTILQGADVGRLVVVGREHSAYAFRIRTGDGGGAFERVAPNDGVPDVTRLRKLGMLRS